MEQLPETTGINGCQIVYETVLQQETMSEAVVPDAMPDIARLLDTQCELYIRSRSVESGCVTLEGSVRAVVLFIGEGEELVQKLEVEMPLTLSAREETILPDDQVIVSAALRSWEGRVIHSRKVHLRAEASAAVSVFRPTAMDFSFTAEEEPPLEKLEAATRLGYIAAVTDKSFVISEEVTLPHGAPGVDRLLSYRLEPGVPEVRPVASKLLLQGETTLELVYLAPGETQVRAASFTIPYSQIMDVPAEDLSRCAVTLLSASVYVEPLPGLGSTDSVSVEAHLLAQCVCTAAREICYVADAYCLHHPCRALEAEEKVFEPFDVTELSQTLTDKFDLPEGGGEVCCCAATASMPVWTESTVRLGVVMRVVYKTPTGELASLTRRLQAEWKRTEELQEYLCSAPRVYDVAALIRDGAMELRCAVTLLCLSAGEKPVRFLRGVQTEETESPVLDGPSAVVVRAGSRSTWELAKRYGSTMALIEAVNEEGAPLLLIPRAR